MVFMRRTTAACVIARAARCASLLVVFATACVRTVQLPAEPQTAPVDSPRRSASTARTTTAPQYAPLTTSIPLPQLERELRGVWIATVDNMDWPSQPGLSTERQKAELLALLDSAAALRLNTIIFQVRPSADALYQSNIEPWSRYLTGAWGRPPEPLWDPLAFAVAEAHARGMELHAWFNPFRASKTSKTLEHPQHIAVQRPDLLRRYGSMQWLDPGEAATREHALRVIRDVVTRYDIDAVHLDDYFYPYIENDARGRPIPFPDAATYARYRDAGGTMSLGDWRRDNINTFIHQLYDDVHRTKPWVKVGISPFGIWRPDAPKGVRGLDAYAEIYADARTWLKNGWLDYLAPQFYWKTDAPQQPYTTLLEWWVAQNDAGRLVLAANGAHNLTRTGWSADEIVRQLELTRAQPGATGNIFFSAKNLLYQQNGLRGALAADAYRYTALVPEMPWLGVRKPARPAARVAVNEANRSIDVQWTSAEQTPQLYLLRMRTNGVWKTEILSGTTSEAHVTYRGGAAPELIAVSSIGRTGLESDPAIYSRL